MDIRQSLLIGWVLGSTRDNAGARIHGFNMHDAFLEQGINSEIAYIPESGYSKEFDIPEDKIEEILHKKYDIVAMTMPNSGDGYYEFIEKLHQVGTKLVCIATDDFNKEYASACDHLIVVADFSKKEMSTNDQHKVSVIFDGYEHDGSLYKHHSNDKKIELVFTSNNVYKKFPQIKQLPQNGSLIINNHI